MASSLPGDWVCAWEVCPGSVPNLTGCRPCLGDLAGPGRHQHGIRTLCDAHTSCTTTMLCGRNGGIQDLGTSPAALIPEEMLAQPGSLWDSREQVPCSLSALLLPTNSISGSHFTGESTQVVYSCWKGGRGEQLNFKKRKKPERCNIKLLFGCWLLVLLLENGSETYGALSCNKPTFKKAQILLPFFSVR